MRMIFCIKISLIKHGKAATWLLSLYLLIYLPPGYGLSLHSFDALKAPPAFNLKDLSGQQHKLKQYRGQVVLVNFWGSWCRSCVEEMPALQRLQNKYAAQGLVVLAVNVNQTDTAIRRFLKAMSLSLTVLKDSNSKTAALWQVNFYPSSFVIDKKGNLRYFAVGAYDWDSAQANETLQELLKH